MQKKSKPEPQESPTSIYDYEPTKQAASSHVCASIFTGDVTSHPLTTLHKGI